VNASTTTRIAVDIGGTFTDFVVFDEATDEVRVAKVLSTPHDPVEAVTAGIERLGIDLSQTEFFVHGTTVGLNALVEGRGATVGLVTTSGFRDVLEIGLMDKKEMYNLFFQRTKPLVPRRRRFEVEERIDAFGEVLIPVDTAGARRVATELQAAGVDSVAVVTLNSYLNPESEAAIARELVEVLGDDVFTCSSRSPTASRTSGVNSSARARRCSTPTYCRSSATTSRASAAVSPIEECATT
jgi:N-methylhydantoinase A